MHAVSMLGPNRANIKERSEAGVSQESARRRASGPFGGHFRLDGESLRISHSMAGDTVLAESSGALYNAVRRAALPRPRRSGPSRSDSAAWCWREALNRNRPGSPINRHPTAYDQQLADQVSERLSRCRRSDRIGRAARIRGLFVAKLIGNSMLDLAHWAKLCRAFTEPSRSVAHVPLKLENFGDILLAEAVKALFPNLRWSISDCPRGSAGSIPWSASAFLPLLLPRRRDLHSSPQTNSRPQVPRLAHNPPFHCRDGRVSNRNSSGAWMVPTR